MTDASRDSRRSRPKRVRHPLIAAEPSPGAIEAPNELPTTWRRTTVESLDWAHYDGPVSATRVPGGVVHDLPTDLRKALIANATALDAWKDITPLARNEFICWIEDAKQVPTRERRIRRTQEELEEGQRRPCCWPGCKHRDRNGSQPAGATRPKDSSSERTGR
jgi:hypothetical protein